MEKLSRMDLAYGQIKRIFNKKKEIESRSLRDINDKPMQNQEDKKKMGRICRESLS